MPTVGLEYRYPFINVQPWGSTTVEPIAQIYLQGTKRQAEIRGMSLADWVAQEGLLQVRTDVPEADQPQPTFDEKAQRQRIDAMLEGEHAVAQRIGDRKSVV